MANKQITPEEVIAWSINQAQSGQNANMPPEMAEFVAKNRQLQHELNCVQQFWQSSDRQQQPSPVLKANFYQMLEQAKTAEAKAASGQTEPGVGLLQGVSNWLFGRPLRQAMALGLCFVFGFAASKAMQPVAQPNEILALKQEINSLSSIVALSMLQNPSASERLNGVIYSRKVASVTPEIGQTLIQALSTDDSSSVRLAIVQTLPMLPGFQQLQGQLLDIALTEDNALVQINLIQTLINNADARQRHLLIQRLQASDLSPEVKVVLDDLTSLTQA